MIKNNRGKSIVLFLFLLACSIGMGYAFLRTELQINGTAEIKNARWDIHFENVIVNPDSVDLSTGNTAATISTSTTEVTYAVTLKEPGDFYEFTVDAVNSGSMDAMIDTISSKMGGVEITTLPAYMEYFVTYSDGKELEENQYLKAGETETYKVHIGFKKNINASDLTGQVENKTLSFSVTYVQADENAYTRPIAMFIDGKSFSAKIKKLAGNNNTESGTTNDQNIKAIRKSNIEPDVNTMTSDNIVSLYQDNPIYAWFDNGTIYYYSDSTTLYLNNNSSWMFNNMQNCSYIELNEINTSKTINMSSMFFRTGYYASSLVMDISNWNTSNVTDMSRMFYEAGSESTTFNIDLSNWNTSNVKYMSNMFKLTGNHATTWDIGNLSNWDTSNVTTMHAMFSNAGLYATTWSIGDLSNWNTSNVTNMGGMFNYAGRNATTWNSIGTLKVYASVSINAIFYGCQKAKAIIKLYKNPADYRYAFESASTEAGSGITVDYTSEVTDIDNIIATNSSANVIKGSLFTP